MTQRRRISRGTPILPTRSEQEKYIQQLQSDPELREAVEELTGANFSEMTLGAQVLAVQNLIESGIGNAAIAAAVRARRDVRRLMQEARGEVELADRVAQLETENDMLREQLPQLAE